MRAVILLALCLTACTDLPRDPDGTSARIAASGEIRVGLTTDTGALPNETAVAGRFLDTLAADMGTRIAMQRGATEPMLARLEAGELDVVISPLADDTPWKKDLALGPALVEADIGGKRHALRPLVRQGENAMLARVYRVGMAMGGRP